MIVPGPFSLRYNQISQDLEDLEKLVLQTLSPLIKGMPNAALQHRTKEIESAFEKLETGRFSAFSELDDLWAMTLIVPLNSDKQAAAKFVEEQFVVHTARGRGESQLSPTDFTFDSIRFYCGLKNSEEPQSLKLSKYVFEIQIKSTLEHAWTSLTRQLNYKEAAPDWRIQRLTAQFKAIVENVDLQLDNAKAYADRISVSPWWESEVRSFLYDAVAEIVSNTEFPGEIRPKNISRVVDCIWQLLRNLDESLIRDLRKRKFDKLEALFALVKANVIARAKKHGPSFTIAQLLTGAIIETYSQQFSTPKKVRHFYVFGLPMLAQEFPTIAKTGIGDISV